MSFSFLPGQPPQAPYVTRLREKLQQEIDLRRQRERELAQARRDLAHTQQRLVNRMRVADAASKRP